MQALCIIAGDGTLASLFGREFGGSETGRCNMGDVGRFVHSTFVASMVVVNSTLGVVKATHKKGGVLDVVMVCSGWNVQDFGIS